MPKIRVLLLLLFFQGSLKCFGFSLSKPLILQSQSTSLQVQLEPDGSYVFSDTALGLKLPGKLPSSAEDASLDDGTDSIGAFRCLNFNFLDNQTPMRAQIRLYSQLGCLVFAQNAPQGAHLAFSPFPSFQKLPERYFAFSYQEREFAPPAFNLNDGSGPWLLFNKQFQALVLSPLSHFSMAQMRSGPGAAIQAGLRPQSKGLSKDFWQETVLVAGDGINQVWDRWGQCLRRRSGVAAPTNDADVSLQKLGYWTDAGSSYWYHYDKSKGYEGTLEDVVESFRDAGLTLSYFQVDSWWYHKSFTDPSGHLGSAKNEDLPDADWNRYGGTLLYQAHPGVFPKGLSEFSRSTGLPLVTHNRWIDPASPYHQRFQISGIAATDPRFWDEIANYLQESGAVVYEQDWLNQIFDNSPELASVEGLGESFLHAMASALKKRGLDLQYCMPLPLHFMEASNLDNVTSIRVSSDRFCAERYHDFLYASRLAASVGLWPWVDVFMSGELDNLILGVLSAGPVGVGDPLGSLQKEPLLHAIRGDGVIVKPSMPLLPFDRDYLQEAEGKKDAPLTAFTCTEHESGKSLYFVLFSDSIDGKLPAFGEKELGLSGPYAILNVKTSSVSILPSSWKLEADPKELQLYELAPLSPGGMALFGDKALYVGDGAQRIPKISFEGQKSLKAELLFSKDERELELHGSRPRNLF